jgi:hypothetical protein
MLQNQFRTAAQFAVWMAEQYTLGWVGKVAKLLNVLSCFVSMIAVTTSFMIEVRYRGLT